MLPAATYAVEGMGQDKTFLYPEPSVVLSDLPLTYPKGSRPRLRERDASKTNCVLQRRFTRGILDYLTVSAAVCNRLTTRRLKTTKPKLTARGDIE